MAMISALMSAFHNDTLEDWVIMHTYADMLNTVSCPFRILRSMGEYEYAKLLSREKQLSGSGGGGVCVCVCVCVGGGGGGGGVIYK